MLTLATECEFRWKQRWHSGKYFDRTGFKFSAQGLNAMLAACPALTKVHIRITNMSRRLKEARSEFNDEFLVALSQHCKCLKALRVIEYESKERPNKTLTRIGNTGLVALTSLPHLCWVMIDTP